MSSAPTRTSSGQALIIERPALLTLLDVGSDTQITVVVAPAGSGKTVLVRSWLAARDPGDLRAWVSVERGERDPQRFWRALASEVSRGAGVDANVDDIAPAPAFNADALIARLTKEFVGLSRSLTVVIDDFHEIKSTEILSGLQQLLDHLPRNVRVVLVSRHDPHLGLHRRRLDGDLTEIRVDQLRFTIEESRELLAAVGITVSDEGLALLHRRTEGWVAGLRLAALSLATNPDRERFVREFSGSERTVAEYLIAEVLEGLPPDVRRLLVRASILDRVNGELGDILTGDSGTERHLRALADAGSFVIALDIKGEWFRFHQLFADLLAAQLRHSEHDAIPRLHQLAAHWYAANGDAIEAIKHALAADDRDLAAGLLLEHYLSLMLDGRQATARSLVDAAVSHSANPELAVLLAADELIAGTLERAETELTLAERHRAEIPDDRRQRFEMMLYITRLALARRIGDFQSVLGAAQPDTLSAEPQSIEDLSLQADVRAYMLMNLGIVEVWSGRLEDGERHLVEAEEIARRIGRPYLQASCHAHRAQSISWRSFTQALPIAQQAIAIAERNGLADDPVTGVALVVLGSCLVSTGQLDAAGQAFRRADERLRSELEPAVGFVLETGHGVINLVTGRYPEAISSFREAERLGTSLVVSSPLALQSRCAMAYSAVLAGDVTMVHAALDELTEAERNSGEVREVAAALALASGNPSAAVAAVEPTVLDKTNVHHPMVIVRSLLLDAKARYLLNDDVTARRSVERALDLAEPDGLVLAFLWVGSSELLERHHRHETAHGAFLRTIQDVLSGRDMGGRRRPGSSHVELTDTELRVLRYLPTNLTASEVAAEIYISVNTVKTHMRSIYTKLDAHSRSEAVEHARDLGLVGRTDQSH